MRHPQLERAPASASAAERSLIADQPESATTLSYVPGEEDGETMPFAACADDACLVIRSGGGRAGETYVLRDERVAIGRHPDANIFLDDVTVSRNHAVGRA